MPNKRLQVWTYFNIIIWVRNNLFLKIYVTSERVFAHIDLYYQQLSIARLPEESAENVGICPRPEDVPGVDVDRIFLDCRQEGYL